MYLFVWLEQIRICVRKIKKNLNLTAVNVTYFFLKIVSISLKLSINN